MPKTRLTATRWSSEWYDRMRERLVLEQQVMHERFPQFRLYRDGRSLYWLGKLRTNRGNTYEIAVEYPASFPDDPPRVKPVNPAIVAYKNRRTGQLMHQYNDGRLCLYFPADRTLQRETTAAVVVAMAAAWFFSYEHWLASGEQEWPGRSAD